MSKKSNSHIKISTFVCVILVFSVIASILCACNKTQSPSLSDAKISKDTKFGAAIIDITIEDFNKLGFELGDSCDISFSNGYKISDVPYFNGYYVKNGEPVIVAYPSNTNVLITLNNVGIWDTAALTNDCTVSISLNMSKKYLATQQALGQSYSLIRSEYSSDEEFSNFRALSGGNLKENFIYRGASPVDNSRNRAPYTDALLEKNTISCVVDLADSESDMSAYLADENFRSEYTKSLYENGNMILLSMGSGYTSQSYKESVVKGFEFMLEHKDATSYYVHCMEGKDRTGFVCALIEALAGATYDEMCADYMKTYENYYKISKDKTPEKYNAIVALYFDSFMECLLKTSDVNVFKTADFTGAATQYLIDGGMSEQSIIEFKTLISK